LVIKLVVTKNIPLPIVWQLKNFNHHMINDEFFCEVTKFFLSLQTWQLKIFNYHKLGDQGFFVIASFMVIETGPILVVHKPDLANPRILLT
jgi:hypothetical protein